MAGGRRRTESANGSLVSARWRSEKMKNPPRLIRAGRGVISSGLGMIPVRDVYGILAAFAGALQSWEQWVASERPVVV